MYYYSFSHSAETQYINSLFYTQIRFTEYFLFSVVRVICLDFMSALDVQIQKKLLTNTNFPLTYKFTLLLFSFFFSFIGFLFNCITGQNRFDITTVGQGKV